MIRVVAFLVGATLLALGVVWLADRPGQVTVTWLGQRADTSVMVAIVGIGLVAVASVLTWSLLRLLFRSPKIFTATLHERRRRRSHEAISRGLVAIGAGDTRAALRHVGAMQNSNEPLALLLRAQTAQLSGDRAGADAAFRALAERSETRLLGLRGLFIEAQRHSDPVAARLAAETAAKEAPALPWAGQAVLEFRCAAGDWQGALNVLENQRRSGMLSRAEGRRRRAVLLTARAITIEEESRDVARSLVLEATRLAPDLVPAAELAGRLLAEAGEPRKATKIIETAWKASPHPELAEVYGNVRLSNSARDRLVRMQALARMTPTHPEGALAVARAALDARDFTVARAALEPLSQEPTQRVAALMAQLNELEGDEGRAREWMARALTAARDPAWTADGYVSDRWLPVSPVTGRLDAFQWKVPVAELGQERQGREERELMIEAPREVASPPLSNSAPETSIAPPPAAPAAPAPANPVATRPARRPAPIMPLQQIPDDPGPDALSEDLDAAVRGETSKNGRSRDGSWQRFRQFFR
jgi:HemY protein